MLDATNPRVLVVADYYLPGFRAGGPIRAIANSVARLAGQTSFFVVTRDHDTDGVRYTGVQPGRWNGGRDAAVYYAPRFTVAVLERCIRESQADVVWLNSFFSRASLRLLLLRRAGRPIPPVLLAPRGEFSPAALALKAARKRTAVRGLLELGCLHGIHWIASSAFEADQIRQTVGASAITIVPESVHTAAPPEAWPVKQRGRLRAVCASRISPMKNQHFLLEVLQHCQAPVDLDLIGPLDDETYWTECRRLIARLPPHVTVTHRGEVAHAELMTRLSSYDLVVLPSRGENFGHAVVEAWSAGCPVLVSDRTPWRALAADGVGWDVPLDRARWVAALERSAAMTDAELLPMRQQSIARARRVWHDGVDGAQALQELIVIKAYGRLPADTPERRVAPDATVRT